MSVNYEWDIETIDPESEDVLDHDHFDSLGEYFSRANTPCCASHLEKDQALVLVRDQYGEADELQNRSHWYPLENEMPMFSNGMFVPKRFVNEFKRWKETK